jgi:streptomycin 6-kinase
MAGRSYEPSELTRARAATLGTTGERWLHGLADAVAHLESIWDLRVEEPMPGASAAFLASVVLSDGTQAVLKIFLPDGATGAASFHQELGALHAGGGDPYVDVLRSDADVGAVLLERLGRSLDSLKLPVLEQLDVIARTLPRGWRRPPPSGLVDGAQKAAWLRGSIVQMWTELGEPCLARTIDTAVAYTHSREGAIDPDNMVLIHGDAHTMNVLEAEPDGRSGRFKLIDPEGLASEPAHDLAIVLRQLNPELLAGDAESLATGWCRHLQEATGVDARAIWEWSSIERVSTGLLLKLLGEEAEAEGYLRAADVLSASRGPARG